MKKVRTIRIDKEVSNNLDSICNRHGDVSWHIEQALNGYGPIKQLSTPETTKTCIGEKRGMIEDERLFDIVWSTYGRKGNRRTSKAKYLRLSQAKKDLIAIHLLSYIPATPDKQYRKNFETYINQECWNDEVTPNAQNQSGPNSGWHKLSAVERVKATTEANRAARESARGDMGDTHGDIRVEPSQPIRDINAQSVGQTLDGAYTEEY